jgi:hypothetical protein
MVSSYVSSVCERKHLDLDNQNYTVEIIVSTRQANGELLSVTNHINVVKGLPHTYSEIVRSGAGQTIDFVAGASGNKRKSEQDKLVAEFSAVKTALANSEQADALAIDQRLLDVTAPKPVQIESSAVVIGPDVPVGEFLEPEIEIVKAKKPRVKKSKKVENDPAIA